MYVKYNFEYEQRIRAGFIGCGGHSYRNIYPTFQYAPIELVAVCDFDKKRAETYKSMFGAKSAYDDHIEMLDKESLDAVFVVTNYENNIPRYPKLAIDIMNAGCHVWIEKPPASSVKEVQDMIDVSEKTGKFVMVGFKKVFFTAISKAKEIISSKEFGNPASIYVRYPQSIPDFRDRENPAKMHGFLDHIGHPASILHYLMGKTKSVYFQREAFNGGTIAVLTFLNGAIGCLHLCAGQSGTSPLERVEVIGSGCNLVVENGVKLTYYRRGERGPGGYGRSSNYIGKDESAPIYWEPEFSLGQLYNKGIFMLGYAPEIIYFSECVLANRPPEKCNLETALEVTKLYEAYKNPDGTEIKIN
ncbi:TPA: Gfo/Idh/MocA family oxidoreductase [Candidatus Poribacteria bacterium]|nr:Gfo/Idh/MocA family oxidoreductase [Candidatus Poribacteria bacterium]